MCSHLWWMCGHERFFFKLWWESFFYFYLKKKWENPSFLMRNVCNLMIKMINVCYVSEKKKKHIPSVSHDAIFLSTSESFSDSDSDSKTFHVDDSTTLPTLQTSLAFLYWHVCPSPSSPSRPVKSVQRALDMVCTSTPVSKSPQVPGAPGSGSTFGDPVVGLQKYLNPQSRQVFVSPFSV